LVAWLEFATLGGDADGKPSRGSGSGLPVSIRKHGFASSPKILSQEKHFSVFILIEVPSIHAKRSVQN